MHPEVDHAGQVQRLEQRLRGTAEVRVVDCLDACDRSNVVVVSPAPERRRSGARPVWLGWVLDDDLLADVCAFVEDGGPGAVELPEVLELARFAPARKSRQAL